MTSGELKAGRLSLPRLGVGCWCFGGGDYWGEQPQNQVNDLVSCALDKGCSFFDTAEAYNEGRSEESLGTALKGRRNQAVIATKVLPMNIAGGKLAEHCEASLKRLRTDVIDLYQIHWPVDPRRHGVSIAEAMEGMGRLAEQGKIRHAGISNFGVGQLGEVLESGIPAAANQVVYNLLSRAAEFDVARICRENGIGILAYMPLMQGLLTGGYDSADELPAHRTRTRHFSGRRKESAHKTEGCETETFDTVAVLKKIALRLGVPLTSLAMSWCAASPAVSSVLTGIRSRAQLEGAITAIDYPLTDEVKEELDEATEGLKTAMGPSMDIFSGIEESRSR